MRAAHFEVARGDDGVIGESLNNLAFVAIMRMDFPRAKQLCDSVNTITDDQIELLVSYILQMRICQRESRNKDFYDSYQQAAQRLRRIDETSLELTPRQQRRMVYARSEYRIVASAYFYYVGLDRQSAQAISGMGEEDLASDTAQLINYWYCYGAGGLLTKGSREEDLPAGVRLPDACLPPRHGVALHVLDRQHAPGSQRASAAAP